MKLFLMYMKNKASTIIQLLSLCIVFFIVFWLYNVPLEPIVFGIELYGVCYILYLIYDFYIFVQKYRILEAQLKIEDIQGLSLPKVSNELEQLYCRLLEHLLLQKHKLYDKDKEFDNRYCYVPGKLVTTVHEESLSWLDIFIHAPFKEDVETSKKYDDKNATSVVVQFGFKINGYTEYKSRVLMGGDAEHEIWQHILDNNTDEEKLQWNIFLAPHHCSWSFFNESDNKEEIKPSAEAILNKQIGNFAHIVASSDEIKDDGKNPPCYEAKQQYIKKLKAGSSHFLNTASHSKVGSIPQPIIFKINENGKTLVENATVAGTQSISNPAPRAGK